MSTEKKETSWWDDVVGGMVNIGGVLVSYEEAKNKKQEDKAEDPSDLKPTPVQQIQTQQTQNMGFMGIDFSNPTNLIMAFGGILAMMFLFKGRG